MSRRCAAGQNTTNPNSERAEGAGNGAGEQGRNKTGCPERSDNLMLGGFTV